MAWTFTPAAQRALSEAAEWTSRNGHDDLRSPELLMGLLAEAECRAAGMLLAHGIDTAAVQVRWPALARGTSGEPREFAPDVTAALDAAAERLWGYPRPLSLATEHVLLGLAAAPSETATWLAEHGLVADQLEAQIHLLYGHDPTPVPLPVDAGAALGETSPLSASSPATTRYHAAQAAVPSPAGGGGDAVLPATHRQFDVAAVAPPTQPAPAPLPTAALRILDAAANRAREGLRVVEDYVRMVLDDRFLTSELKHLRHELHTALGCLPAADLLGSRDTLADVGTSISTSAEFTRTDPADVAAANWKRLQEALRSLEEFAKVGHPALAAAVEKLRYRTYTLERAAGTLAASLTRLAGVKLCVLIDGRASSGEFERLVDALLAGGVSMIQLRDKQLADRELIARAQLLRARTAAAGALCIINDRADIAAAVRADGVHVGQDDLPIKAVRAILGPRALVGSSTHSILQAREAVLAGADYIGVGPTFPSTTKQFDAFTGTELLRAVAAEIQLPAFAIGGVKATNLEAVLASGISRVAVSGAVAAAADPRAAAAAIVQRLASTP